MADRRIGVYPGTFDPITLGHLDIIRRGTRVVDHLIVAVAGNDGKNPLFEIADRVAMVEDDITGLKVGNATVEVRSFDSLLVSFAEEVGASVIIRGLRAVSDFEYEFQMVGMNSRLKPALETVFLMASDNYQFISSRFVKEICRLGGDISQFVTPAVAARVKAKVAAG
ncbi:MAG: pantetheine-phosphate adenylyltransferase [Alphaproteobacteria bacterium]|nr:pantetheine-phosphate adenylyltransferase [Alphaproteobacteria bacterium]